MNYMFEVDGEQIVVYEMYDGKSIGDFRVMKDDVQKLIKVLMCASGTPIPPRLIRAKKISRFEFVGSDYIINQIKDKINEIIDYLNIEK